MKPLYVMIEDDIYEALRKTAFKKHVSLAKLTRAILKKVFNGESENVIQEKVEIEKNSVQETPNSSTHSSEENEEFDNIRVSKEFTIAKGKKRQVR